MAIVQKNYACEVYYKGYTALTDTKKKLFSKLCNKLISENFVYGSKPDDKNDYYEILSMKEIIECYFNMMDYDLIHVDTYKLFYIQTTADRNRLKLKKFETVIILVLRLLYQKGSLDINSNSDITTTLGKLKTELNQTGIFKNQISATEFWSVLRLMKRYKIIDFDFSDLNEDNAISIYPTVLYVVKIDTINMITDKIKTYIATKGDEEDEINED